MSDQPIPAADSVEKALTQFSMAFTVRDLMTAQTALVGADNAQAACKQHERYGYDVIAHPSAGPTTGYYYRGGALTHLTPADLVSCDTNLLDLLPLLAEREFFFALHGTQISGYVHFSDLNKPLMRMPFYMLLEATERHILSVLRRTLTEDQAKGALTPSRVSKLQEYLDTAARQRADTNFWDVLGLPDVLEIARKRGLARISEKDQLARRQAADVIRLRNSIAHTGHPLVESHQAVGRLIVLRKLCSQLRALNGATADAPPNTKANQ